MPHAERFLTESGSANPANDDRLTRARQGDIGAFYELYSGFKDELRSFLYRVTADRANAEDLAQDAFVRAFERIADFEGRSTLKTWVFSIALRFALDDLRRRRRWPSDILDLARAEAQARPPVRAMLAAANTGEPHATFEIREHIAFCFSCIGKTLPLEQQVALLLRDIYRFSTAETAQILGTTEASTKHAVRAARQTMTHVFDDRCALISQNGACHQCSQLNGWLNPKQDTQQIVAALALVRESSSRRGPRLLALRERLVQEIDPLNGRSAEVHAVFYKLHRHCAGEPGALDPTPNDGGTVTAKRGNGLTRAEGGTN